MTNSEITHLSLTEVARAIASKKLSSVEVTRACLQRIEQHDDKLNTIAGQDGDVALAAASRADDDLAAGNARGPLHGVPLAHKDLFFRAGEPSEWGSSMMTGHRPNTTATVLTRLDAAGALDTARLNMVEFALGATGHNNDTGTPRNPWNPDYITGGSSSGSGSAVAARFVFGALGTDTGGSIRHPAYCCGLVGLKPTYGRVSRYSAMPLSFSLDHIGLLSRTVSDSARIVQAIAGHDPKDPTTSAMPIPNYLESLGRSLKGLRIAIPENHFQDAVDPVVRPFLDDSIEVFAPAVLRSCRSRFPNPLNWRRHWARFSCRLRVRLAIASGSGNASVSITQPSSIDWHRVATTRRPVILKHLICGRRSCPISPPRSLT